MVWHNYANCCATSLRDLGLQRSFIEALRATLFAPTLSQAVVMASVTPLSVPPALERILRDIAAKYGFQETKLHVTSGSGAGDGYTSTVYRATITDDANPQNEALSLICKTSMPIFRDTMSRMYEIEAYTYEVVLPAMENIARLTDPLPWPRYEFSDVQGPPPHTLVLVDMRPEGFAMADRSVFLDVAHCRLALKQLARFHGAGLALKHLKPDHFEEIKKRLNLSIWDTAAMRENLKPYHSAMVQVPHVVRDKFPEGSDVHTRLKKLFGAFKEDSVALMGPLTGPGYTIIHNDLHVINMMYQYDRVTNAVTDCRLIDFQMCVYGLPALDIVTILLVCTDKPMRDLHWDNLLQGYHQELLATLSAAGCSEPEKLFPWTLLQDQLKIAAPYGLCVTPVYHFGLYSDAETVEELRQIMADNANSATNGEQREVTLKVTPALKTRLEGLVQDVADKGWLPTVEELENRLAAYAQEKKSARVH